MAAQRSQAGGELMTPNDHWKKAFELLAAACEEARLADAERRKRTEKAGTQIPQHLGVVKEKFWLVVGPNGVEQEEREQPVGRHLTVWRTQNWEVTVTFDRWEGRIDSSGHLYSRFRASEPPHNGWEPCGTTQHNSTIWRRPLKEEN